MSEGQEVGREAGGWRGNSEQLREVELERGWVIDKIAEGRLLGEG